MDSLCRTTVLDALRSTRTTGGVGAEKSRLRIVKELSSTISVAILGPGWPSQHHHHDNDDLLISGGERGIKRGSVDSAFRWELGCYAFFMFDVWHLNAGLTERRTDVLYSEIVPHFLSSYSIGADEDPGLLRAFEARFDAYMRIFLLENDDVPLSISRAFEQRLADAIRSLRDGSPDSVMDPATGLCLPELVQLQRAMRQYVDFCEEMLPRLLECFQLAYHDLDHTGR